MAELKKDIAINLVLKKVLVFANIFVFKRPVNFDFGLKLYSRGNGLHSMLEKDS